MLILSRPESLRATLQQKDNACCLKRHLDMANFYGSVSRNTLQHVLDIIGQILLLNEPHKDLIPGQDLTKYALLARKDYQQLARLLETSKEDLFEIFF